MASRLFSIIFLLLLLLTSTFTHADFVQSESPAGVLGADGRKEEKLSHFRFYWHDIVSGRNPTSIPIISGQKKSTTAFGQVNMIDNPLTEGPDVKTSKLVGRSQGLYGGASQENVGLIMAMNFCFLEGKYNGSTITILGHNAVFDGVREMPVIGGSGMFRFARGYAQLKTQFLDMKTGDATIEYNVYVLHF